MSNSFDETARLALISRVLLVSVGLPMFIFGIVGNLFNTVAFGRLPQFNKLSSSIFLLSSSLASQIDLIVGLLPQLVYRISGTDPLTNIIILCKIRWFIGPLTGTVALHSICLAAINQYLFTSRRVRHHHWITRRRAVVASVCILLIWIGPLSPAMIFYTNTINSANITECNIINPIFAMYYTYISIIIYSLIPIVVLSIFSVLTWKNVRSNLIRCQSLEQSLTRILLGQIVMVLLTTVPNVIAQIYLFYTRTTPKNSLRLAEENVVSSAFTLLGFSTHSMSFYTYILTSKAFRENIRSLFVRRQHRIEPAIMMNNINQQKRIFFQSRT